MKKYTLRIFLAGLGLLALCGTAYAEAAVGQAAPEFSLQDSAGATHSLADLKGKLVVLEWVNPDCPFVRKHYDSQNMQGLQAKYTAQDVVWLSIASSAAGKQGHYSAADWKGIVQKEGSKASAVLLDADGAVGRLYGAQTTPHMYVISPQGNLIYKGAIDSIPSPNPADVSKAENYVDQALTQYMAGEEIKKNSTKAYGCSVKY